MILTFLVSFFIPFFLPHRRRRFLFFHRLDSTRGTKKLTVYVDDPAQVIFLPISHPDGLDQIKEIQIGSVKGELNLTNSTVDGTGIMKGKNPIAYRAKKGSAAAREGRDTFTYTVYDQRNKPAEGTVEIEVGGSGERGGRDPPLVYSITSLSVA